MVDTRYLQSIKHFEGYADKARWDYAQHTNGYGTRALYAGEVIDKDEADRRFKAAIQKAEDFVDKFAPNLDDGSKAALTSLTYNAGTTWSSSGLGQAVSSGDLDKARSLFVQYNKAGGSVIDGLVKRRLEEAAWFGQGTAAATATATAMSPAASALAIASSAAASAGSMSAGSDFEGSPQAAATATLPPRAQRAEDGTEDIAGIGSDDMLVSLLSKLNHAKSARDAHDHKKSNDDDDKKQRSFNLALGA
jgi:lysozyme